MVPMTARYLAIVTLIALSLLAGGGARLLAYQEVALESPGSVAGSVRFSGSLPPAEEITITKNQDVCGQTKKSDALVIGSSRGVKGVIVTIEGIGSGKAIVLPDAAHVTSNRCSFEPRVQAIPVGARLELRNEDAILHNAHGRLNDAEDVFNVALPTKGLMLRKLMKKPGLVTVNCDAGHEWTRAYVLVTDHPYYAVTDTSGAFSLKEVPSGAYTLTAWHEVLGTQTSQVTVRPLESAEASIVYSVVPPSAIPTPAPGSVVEPQTPESPETPQAPAPR